MARPLEQFPLLGERSTRQRSTPLGRTQAVATFNLSLLTQQEFSYLPVHDGRHAITDTLFLHNPFLQVANGQHTVTTPNFALAQVPTLKVRDCHHLIEQISEPYFEPRFGMVSTDNPWPSPERLPKATNIVCKATNLQYLTFAGQSSWSGAPGEDFFTWPLSWGVMFETTVSGGYTFMTAQTGEGSYQGENNQGQGAGDTPVFGFTKQYWASVLTWDPNYEIHGYYSGDGTTWTPFENPDVSTWGVREPWHMDVPLRLCGTEWYTPKAQVHWMEMRTGAIPGSGDLIWRMDASEYRGGSSWTDARGRTWTPYDTASMVPGFALSQNVNLTAIQDGAHVVTSPNVVLVTTGTMLVVDDAIHAFDSDNATLGITLVVANAAHTTWSTSWKFFQDDFNRPDGPLTAPWISALGGNGVPRIASSSLNYTTANSNYNAAYNEDLGAGHFVEFDTNTDRGVKNGVLVNVSSDNSSFGYKFYWEDENNDTQGSVTWTALPGNYYLSYSPPYTHGGAPVHVRIEYRHGHDRVKIFVNGQLQLDVDYRFDFEPPLNPRVGVYTSHSSLYSATPHVLDNWVAGTYVDLTLESKGAVRFDNLLDYYNRSASGIGSAYTMACWAYLSTDRNGYATFIGADLEGLFAYIGTHSDGTTLIFWDNQSSGIAPGVELTVGKWYWLAAVTDGVNPGRLYFAADDALSLSSQMNAPEVPLGVIGSGWTFWIGGDGFNDWLDGRVAQVKVWSAALSPAELQLEWKADHVVRTSNLWAYYSFSNGPQTLDESVNNRTLNAGGTMTGESGPPVGPVNLAVADGLHGHTADNISLTVPFTSNDSYLVVTSDNVDLVVSLSVQNADHGLTSDNTALGVTLPAANAAHAHAADSVVLYAVPMLVVANANHALLAPSAVVEGVVITASATHAHTASHIALGINLVVQSGAHAVVSTEIDPIINITTASGAHQLTSGNITLQLQGDLAVQDALHLHTASNVAPLNLSLTVQSAIHALASDNVALTTNVGVQDAAHAHTAGNVALGVDLVVNSTVHAHSATQPALVKNLVVNDALHAHTAANVALGVRIVPDSGLLAVTSPQVKLRDYIILNDAVALYMGSATVSKAYVGSVQVWP